MCVCRSDQKLILAVEKCIMKGRPVLLENCTDHIDSMITPIIGHRNTALESCADDGMYRCHILYLSNHYSFLMDQYYIIREG